MKRFPATALVRVLGRTSPSAPQRLAASGTPASTLGLVNVRARNQRLRIARDAMHRGFDIACSVPVLILLIPVWCLAAISFCLGRHPVKTDTCLGKDEQSFRRYRLDFDQLIGGAVLSRMGLSLQVAQLLNVVLGDMAIVGPRPILTSEARPNGRLRLRSRVRPGLVCLWWLRRQANIPFGDEWHADVEYVRHRSVTHDLGILARCGVAMLYGKAAVESGEASINGIRFDNLTMSEAIDQIGQALRRPGLTRVAFINADCMNLASRNRDYRQALQGSDLVFADGIGIKLAGRLIGCPVKENVNGTDLFPLLCRSLAGTESRLFLLGGRRGVAERVQEWIQTHAPGVRVCGHHHGYFQASEQADVLEQIDRSKADLVLVAFGAPKQDVWIRDVLASSQVRVAIGVGGLFDFYSGRIPRAPLWMREMGLEWTYRLYQEPQRLWRRYIIGNASFLIRTIVYRIRNGHPQPQGWRAPTLGTSRS